MKKIEEAKKWISEHEREVKKGVKIAAGLIITVVICKKISKAGTKLEIPESAIDIPKVEKALPKELIEKGFEIFDQGSNWMEIADYNDYGIELSIDDMHRCVNALRNIPGFTENSRIQAMFNVYNLE